MTQASTSETFGFQTEAKQLLQLMIHSLYSNREIFLRELISNASDAIDRLRFRAISDPDLLSDGAEFAITIEFDAEQKTLKVSDNGMGMTPEITKQIFNPFFTTKSKVVGIGLGLSVSYGIIQSHGGTIEVESTPGKGSSFTVLLPIRNS